MTDTYDANGFALTATGSTSYVSATTYQPWGDVFQRVLGDPAGGNRVQLTTDQYTDRHLAKTITVATEHTGAPGTFDEKFSQQYQWDPAGNATEIDNQSGGATTDAQCFSYDYVRQLTTAWTTTPATGGCAAGASATTVSGPDAYWQSYTYDPAGNRQALTSHGLGGVSDTTSTYTYPTAGTAQAHALSSVDTAGPGGSITSGYTYLGGGQLANATIGGLSTDYTWRNQGPVATATVHAGTGDQTTTYFYDADGNEILRDTPTGKTLYLGGTDVNVSADGNTLTGAVRYYACDDTVVASRTLDGTLSWLANDDQGTAQVTVDPATLAVTVRKQDPFGNACGSVPNWPNPRTFVGGTTEPTGLIHLGARMYDPGNGRFISDDPVTDTDNPQQLNGYSYGYNNPATYSDPDGEWGFHVHFKSLMRTVANVASVASIIPGPIGMVAAGVSAGCYAAAGDWRNAAMMAAGIALSAVGAGAVVAAVRIAKVAKAARAATAGFRAVKASRFVGKVRGIAKAIGTAGKWAVGKIRNGNNFIRFGRQTQGAPFRLSLGPVPKHYAKLGRIGRFFSPIHVHLEWRKVGIDFNWGRRSFYRKW